jgi:AcrR family transcriptional regulator
MSSQKASVAAKRPQRQRGRERVAALLRAGADVFAERGYEAATMTEVAARAGASIGSLYQFFPTKELLAAGVLQDYLGGVHRQLEDLAARAAAMPVEDLADSLFGLLAAARAAYPAFAALVEGFGPLPAMTEDIRKDMRRLIAAVLQARAPQLAPAAVEALAIATLQMMKAAAALATEVVLPGREAGLGELRAMLRRYLAAELR